MIPLESATPSPIAGQPQVDGEPVFDAPWQSRTFALAVQLHRAGVFTWREWSTRLAHNIAALERHGKIKSNADYYEAWQTTLEEVVDAVILGR